MSYTVIIADDEPIIRMGVADMLREEGISVLGEASDGFDAVSLAQQHHPDVVLMDIKMPVFDGLAAAREIMEKQLAKTVILVTAYCDAAFIAAAKEIGAGGYLVKPIQPQTLLPAIEIALAHSERYAKIEERERAALQKVQDQQLINRAKAVIAQRMGISEREALALMQRESMNKRCALTLYAQGIIDAYVDDDTVRLAKQKLMEQYHLSDRAAYQRLKALCKERGESIYDTAKKLLFAER